MEMREGEALHNLVDFVGLRAQATAVGLLQLSTELVRAGVLGPDAIDRIKDAIAKDIVLSRPRRITSKDFERATRERLDRLFAGEESVSDPSPLNPDAGS